MFHIIHILVVVCVVELRHYANENQITNSKNSFTSCRKVSTPRAFRIHRLIWQVLATANPANLYTSVFIRLLAALDCNSHEIV